MDQGMTGLWFSLVPWKPVMEKRAGQQLAATVRGGCVSWEIGRQRGPAAGETPIPSFGVDGDVCSQQPRSICLSSQSRRKGEARRTGL